MILIKYLLIFILNALFFMTVTIFLDDYGYSLLLIAFILIYFNDRVKKDFSITKNLNYLFFQVISLLIYICMHFFIIVYILKIDESSFKLLLLFIVIGIYILGIFFDYNGTIEKLNKK